MTRYDVHQHLWPEPFLAALRRREAVPYVRNDTLVTPEGAFPFDPAANDAERRIAQLDRDGIDVAVVSLQTSLGIESLPQRERAALEETWLDGAVDVVARSRGRLRALAPWRVEDGFVGTSVGVSALLDPARSSAMDRADAVAGVVFVHPEAEGPLPDGRPEWWGWTAGYTSQMQAAYLAWLADGRARWPSVRVVFAMLAGGAPFHHERLAHRGVDVRSTLDPGVLFETATYGRRAIELCIETFGVERLVYGSDTPVVDPRPTLAAVRGFGDSVARLLQTDTPEALFG